MKTLPTSKSVSIIICALLIMLTFNSRGFTATEVLFQDNFNRADSDSLGAPWTEVYEVIAEYYNPTPERPGHPYVGPGYIELQDQKLVYHYNFPADWQSHFYNNDVGHPYAVAPLSRAVTGFPLKISFSFMPHVDTRTYHILGLMTGSEGFTVGTLDPERGTAEPKSAIAVMVVRSGIPWQNSQVTVFLYKHGIRYELTTRPTSFQFDYGNEYFVNFYVLADYSTLVEISDGSVTDSPRRHGTF
jgi:hypothetical protein